MAYNQNIPQATDTISSSQAEILANFQALKTLIDINHGTFGAADEGKHKYVTMPEQSSAPTTAADEMALYTKAVSGVTQMFLRNEGSGTEVDFTSATKSNSNGTLTLPCGIILKWGRATTNASGLSTVNFTTAFPTAVLTAYASTAVVGGSNTNSSSYDVDVRIYNYTTSLLSAVTYSNNTARTRLAYTYTWFAIGY